ncbi:phosphatase PAP2 family protein [Natronolimnohabitans innermongolicus]|uniref:PA-phosphatase-like phosphoesterase n=1 Tax=Natronolimnohabitans innermongolicus JCM 12255 TaxID=1227499 RepID=L9XHA0_9EURY|nr:phosphatase PAP2 family protein [Natronolimnohabitans innermongolicus]ELY61085.1 PA-phosphatase-like phosphoesterase [Natronolimnohabitans innermongolicus JCM 12255]
MSRGLGVTEAIVGSVPEWLVDLFASVSYLGDLAVIVPALGLLYLVDVRRGLRGGGTETTDGADGSRSLCSDRTAFLVAAVFGGLALVVALKGLFTLPRPPAAWHAVSPSEYGFPSGHTMAATVFWGSLALWTTIGRRPTRLAVAAAVVSLVALSRLVLGVHFFVDVVASVAFGAVYLLAIARLARGRPERAFAAAIALALGAMIVTGGESRAVLALVGTVGGAAGWWLTERPIVRERVRNALQRAG